MINGPDFKAKLDKCIEVDHSALQKSPVPFHQMFAAATGTLDI